MLSVGSPLCLVTLAKLCYNSPSAQAHLSHLLLKVLSNILILPLDQRSINRNEEKEINRWPEPFPSFPFSNLMSKLWEWDNVYKKSETSFLVQGLRLWTSSVRGRGLIPDQVTKIPHALWWGQMFLKRRWRRKERRKEKLQGVDKSACNGKWQQIWPPPHLNDWLKILSLFLLKNFHGQAESSELVLGHHAALSPGCPPPE